MFVQCNVWQMMRPTPGWQCLLHSPRKATGSLPVERPMKKVPLESLFTPGIAPSPLSREGMQVNNTDTPTPARIREKPVPAVKSTAALCVPDTSPLNLSKRQAVCVEKSGEIEGKGPPLGTCQFNEIMVHSYYYCKCRNDFSVTVYLYPNFVPLNCLFVCLIRHRR